MQLNKNECELYSRQMILPDFGETAQLKLQQAKVLVAGAGGLGCPALSYLAAAGIGTIGIADNDVVGVSNLHRQVLFGVDDVGKHKAIIAKEKLSKQYPHISFEVHTKRISSENAIEIISGYDVIVDGTDNFPAKYLLNDACVIAGKILVYGSILRYEGQVAVFNHQTKINYRDLFPEPPQNVPNCSEAGVLGPLCGIIGSIQANEAIKVITGTGESLDGKLMCYDSLHNSTAIFKLNKDPENHPLAELTDYDLFCSAQTPAVTEINTLELREMLNEEDVQLIDVREPWEKQQHDDWGGELIPLNDIESQAEKISRDKKVVLYCKTGMRSRQAVLRLQKLGFNNLINLAG